MLKKLINPKANRRMAHAAITTILLSAATAAFAQPSVNGNEISWPDDGWYQVQRSDTYESICNGGSTCTVPAGRYTVINHSTGVRFKVDVIDSADPDDTPIDNSATRTFDGVVTVSGNTLSWPDDGWYQVQDTADNSEACAGGLQCQVAPGGTYRVINHSTGQRIGPIVIGQAIKPPSGPQPAYSVEGNQLTWHFPGWHQLQDAVTYQSICEGPLGTVCIVSPGIYKLINHTAEIRYPDIEILDDSPENVYLDASPVNLTGVAYTDSEAEIFWEAATTGVAVVGYEIIRNGTTIAASLDALSFYDNTVEAGVSYDYQVVALDATGRMSEAASISIHTPAAYNTVNANNYLDLTRYLFSIAHVSFTNASEEFVSSFRTDELYLTSAFSLNGSQFDEEASRVFTFYSCEQAGLFTHSPSGSALGGESGQFDDCEFGNTHANGRYNVSNSISKFVLNPGFTTEVSYDLFVSNPAASPATELVGVSSNFEGEYMQVQSWDIERFMSPSFNGMTLITEFSHRMSRGAELQADGETAPYQSSLEVDFNIQSPDTGNKPISYTTTETLRKNAPDGKYESGSIFALATDGSWISIDFNTGNPNTADVTVNSGALSFTESLLVSDYM